MTSPIHAPGICVWLTGLSGSGKTTTARALYQQLLEQREGATILDGDVVRTRLSEDLGFSRADRDEHAQRVGAAAREIVLRGGIVICALISPYRATRCAVRNLVGPERFIEVFVAAPLHVCESRDPKGLYARARLGGIQRFTGIDDPYEEPLAPDVVLDTVECSPDENAGRLLGLIRSRRYPLTC